MKTPIKPIDEATRREIRERIATRIRPPIWSRALHLGSLIVSTGLFGYLVLFHDFGIEENCFTSIRSWAKEKHQQFWTLSEEEKVELGVKSKS
jgi:hypothetical protein